MAKPSDLDEAEWIRPRDVKLSLAEISLLREALWFKYQRATDEALKREIAIVDTRLLRIWEVFS